MIRLNLNERSYQIIVGNGVLASLGRRCAALKVGARAVCVTNAAIPRRYIKAVRASFTEAGIDSRVVVVSDGEKSKSFNELRRLLGALARDERGAPQFIAAVGGGTIGDLAGFAAAIYKRGIPYVQVPTTLLAQVDSAIGGKTAIDLPEGKNLVGAFYQPRLVVSDISLLASLNRRQFISGIAEALKYGIIKDRRLFTVIERNSGSLSSSSSSVLCAIVEACSAIKARIVERDERDDMGVRIILNFGHTIGHAIEAAQGYGGYTHGEAIAIGMVCACDISAKMGFLDPATAIRIERAIAGVGLPVTLKGVAFGTIADHYFRDKKFKGKSRLVLLEGIGVPRIVENVPLELVKEVVRKRMV